MKIFKTLLVASVAAFMFPATAADFDFANLQWNGGPANTGFLPSDGISCTGGDLCSSDVNANVRNGDLTYTSDGITVVATGSHGGLEAAVVQDYDDGYDAAAKVGAGLGVYHVSGDTSDDNVTASEVLTLTFDQAVKLTSISLRAEGHNVTGWADGSTFLLNGANTLLPKNVGSIALDLTGTVFHFAYGGDQPDQFYLGGLTATVVPEPANYALLIAGLAAVGFVTGRRTNA